MFSTIWQTIAYRSYRLQQVIALASTYPHSPENSGSKTPTLLPQGSQHNGDRYGDRALQDDDKEQDQRHHQGTSPHARPLIRWRRPWLFLAIGLHGLLFFLPYEPSPESSDELDELAEVMIIEPPIAIIDRPIIPPAPVPASPVTPSPWPSPVPLEPTLAAPVLTAPPPSPDRPTLPPPVPLPIPISEPTPTPVASPTPELPPEPTPTPTPDPLPTPTASLTPPPAPALPYIEGAVSGCNQSDQCWETTTPISQVRPTLLQSLSEQGYEVTDLTDRLLPEASGRRIYQVSQADEEYYLNLISTTMGTVYYKTDAPLSTEEMDAIAGFNAAPVPERQI